MYKLKIKGWNKDRVTECIFVVLGFLMGRVVLFNGINGCALGYLSCFAFGKRVFYPVAAAVFAGLMTVRRTMDIGEYVIGILLLCLLNFLGTGRVNDDKKYFFGGLALLSGALLCAGFTGNFVYYCIVGTLEAIFTVVVAMVFNKGIEIVNSDGKKEYIDGEEILSIFILTTAVVCGWGSFEIGGISPVFIVAVTVIFISSVKGGCMLGAACGAFQGTILAFANIYPIGIIPALTIGGLTGAMAGKIHRAFMPVGFVLSFAPIVLYYKLDLLSLGVFVSVIVGGIINMYVPHKLYLSLYNLINTGFIQSNLYTEEVKNALRHKLKKLSDCFTDLDAHIQTAAVSEEYENIKFEIFDKCTSNVCSRCSRQNTCWESNYKITYDNLYGLIDGWVDKGNVDFKNLPNYFVASCSKYRELILWAKNSIDEMKFRNLSIVKKAEYRQLLSLYMKNISAKAENIADEIMEETNTDRELSDNLYRKTAFLGIKSLSASKGKRGYVLRISLPQSFRWEMCEKRILPFLKDCLGVNMIKTYESCNRENNMWNITLEEEPPFRISAYCCSVPKGSEEICGDSFIFTDLENGRYLLALADGMGSGKTAGRESAAAVEMFQDFTEAGFQRDDALELINSLVSEKEESFSTLDICTVDKYSGKAEFIKIGAVSTFISGKKGVEILKANTLPVGILENVDTEIYEKRLEKGDCVVMITDGIAESGKSRDNENWLKEILKGGEITTAEFTAKKIMERAVENSKNNINDDMTVLVANIY